MATKQHFALLDGLRGLAAVAVMLRHLDEMFRLPQIVGHGYLAVDFFFILSGFVICWAYERRLATGWSNTDFFRVRLIRLLPLIALGSVIGGVVTGLERLSLRHVVEATLLSMLAIPFPWRGALFPVNGPLWSMFYELVSNFVYAVVRPRLNFKVLLAALAVAAAAVIFVAIKIKSLDVGFLINHSWAGALRLAFPFLAGVLIYRLYMREFAPGPRAPAWVLVLSLIAVLVMPKMGGPVGSAFDILCSLVVLPAIVWLGLRAQVSARFTGLCALAGELSYPVYVIHKPIETAFSLLARDLAAPGRAALACGCVVGVFSLAGLASRKYDVPLRRLLTAMSSRSSGTIAVSASRLSNEAG